MVEWLLLLLASLLSLCYLKFWWSHRRILSTASQLPCPPTYPLIGNLHYFTGGITCITNNLNKFATEFKGLFCMWIGPLPIIFVADSTIAQKILSSSSHVEKDELVYDGLKPFLGNGLVTAPASIWKKTHRLIAPVLHPSNVELFLPDINDACRELSDELGCGKPIDPKVNLFDKFLDIVTRKVVGGIYLDDSTKHKITHILTSVGRFVVYRALKLWLQFDIIFNTLYRSELKVTYQYLADCTEFFNKVWPTGNENPKVSPSVKCGEDILEEDHSKNVSRTSVRDVVKKNSSLHIEGYAWPHDIFTMVAAGIDTTVHASRFLLFTLASYPQVQAKVRAEIKEVMNDSDRDVTPSDLQAMTYLNCALLESIRLHGSVPFIARRIVKDLNVDNINKCTLPVGSHVIIQLQCMGLDPDKFPEPDKFNPERFLDTKDTDKNFMPFSVGPRRCIGRTYSNTLVKTLIVHLLRKYHLTTKMKMEDIEYEMAAVMESKSPMYINFHPIEDEMAQKD